MHSSESAFISLICVLCSTEKAHSVKLEIFAILAIVIKTRKLIFVNIFAYYYNIWVQFETANFNSNEILNPQKRKIL